MLFFLDLSKLNPFRFQSVSKLIVELTESKKNFNLINPSSKMRGFIFEKTWKTSRSGISIFFKVDTLMELGYTYRFLMFYGWIGIDYFSSNCSKISIYFLILKLNSISFLTGIHWPPSGPIQAHNRSVSVSWSLVPVEPLSNSSSFQQDDFPTGLSESSFGHVRE